MAANNGVCSIEISSDLVGFFGQMNWCLYILQYCERLDLVPDIKLTGPLYIDPTKGDNWLDYYFDWRHEYQLGAVGRNVRYTRRIGDFQQMGPPIAPALSLEEGARLFRKFLRPKSHIIARVEDFWRSLDVDEDVLGIHYRGTDKAVEAPRVSWQHCLDVLRCHLNSNPTVRAIFVASDEAAFVDFMRESVHEVPVHFHADHFRSSSGEPIHTANGNGYAKGEDAIVNALLLSKCTTLVRTTSLLSAWASIFNPDLKVILLNKPFGRKLWYPEREILKQSNTRYLPDLKVQPDKRSQ